MELPEFDTRHLHARGEIVDTENVATLPHTTEDAIAFLADYANDLTTRCRVTADMGGSLYLPDASHTSSHFRTRDFASLLAGSPDTLDVQDLQNMIERLLATQREDGLFPETLASDGTPHYGRGNPVGESAPAYDVPQAVVSITWHVYQKTGDLAFLKKALPRLIKGITTLPCHARTELVHIAPDIPSTAYADGYTSTPNKKGDLLYSSLLYVQAQNDLADMAQSLGRDGDADMWRANAEHISKRIRMYLWDKDSGLFRASTENAAVHDIWGSALAVYMNVATSGQLMAVSKYLQTHYHEVVYRGYVRQVAPDLDDEETAPHITYCNEWRYWALPAGWVAYTLNILDPSMADQLLFDLTREFAENGVHEWIGDDGQTGAPDYVASVTLPLAGFRRIMTRRQERDTGIL